MKLTVASSPFLRSNVHTSYLMRQVIIALIPAIAASIYFFGKYAAFLILNCAVTAVATEYLVLKIRKKEPTINDYSALLTGILLALILPPAIKWYAASLGTIVAILIGKQLFGGLGANIFNPALLGRAFLMAAYPKMLTTYIKPGTIDAVTSATPLAQLKFNHTTTPILNLFFGNVSGSLGETSAVCLIAGGIYLLIRKIADWRIPASLLVTVAAVSSVFYLLNPGNGSVLFHICGGGMLIGAFFMATDPATTPVTKKGRYIFGIACGLLIMVIRYFGGLPEGVMYSILFLNAFTPLINRYTRPKRYGS